MYYLLPVDWMSTREKTLKAGVEQLFHEGEKSVVIPWGNGHKAPIDRFLKGMGFLLVKDSVIVLGACEELKRTSLACM